MDILQALKERIINSSIFLAMGGGGGGLSFCLWRILLLGIRKAKIPGSRQSISFCFRGTLLWGTSCDFKLSHSHAHLSLALLSVFRETLSVPTFHYIYNNLLRYYEMIMVEKKEAIVWGRRSVDGLVMLLGAVDGALYGCVMCHSPKLCT